MLSSARSSTNSLRRWSGTLVVLFAFAAQSEWHRCNAQGPSSTDLRDLQSANPIRAHDAGKRLGDMAGDALSAYPTLVTVMRSSHSTDVSEVCVWAIGRIAESAGARLSNADAESAADYLIINVRTKEKRPSLRQASAYALGRLAGSLKREDPDSMSDPLLEEAVEALTQALKDGVAADEHRKLDFGRAVADAIGRFRPQFDWAANDLSGLLRDVTNRLNIPGDNRETIVKLEEFQGSLAEALSHMGRAARPAVPRFKVMLESHDPRVQATAAYALRNIGASARDAAPELLKAMTSGEVNVRQASVFALGRVRPQGKEAVEAVTALSKAVTDSDSGVREAAIAALSNFNAEEVQPRLAALTPALNDNDPYVCQTAAETLSVIAEKIAHSQNTAVTKHAAADLQQVLFAMQKALAAAFPGDPSYDALDEGVRRVKDAAHELSGRRLLAFIRQHPLPSSFVGICFAWFLALRFLILRRWPTWLLHANDLLDQSAVQEVSLPFGLAHVIGPLKVPLRYLLLVGFFRYHSRVLDGWVKLHSPKALENFQKRTTVKERHIYVPLPVEVDDGKPRRLLGLTPYDLRATCSQDRWCIRLIGEGGSGKTTLAHQIAKWSMEEDPAMRLAPDRRCLPVLLEPGMALEFAAGKPLFQNLIRTQLKDITGMADLIPEELLDHLLQSRRILVVVDGASEMGQFVAGDNGGKVTVDPSFPACAVVVTARTVDAFTPGTYTEITPSRMRRDHLSSFVDTYLYEAEFQIGDVQWFEACAGLAAMVGEQGITPLLAQMYVKEMIKTSGERSALQNLPETIPELMLNYVEDLAGPKNLERLDSAELHRVAKQLAWECVGSTLRPAAGDKRQLALPEKQISSEWLSFFRAQLGLIEDLPDLKFRFLLDPLAEYLAALHLIDEKNSDEELWRDFLDLANKRPGAPKATLGFLTALDDSLAWRMVEFDIPKWVKNEVNARVKTGRKQIANRPKSSREQTSEATTASDVRSKSASAFAASGR